MPQRRFQYAVLTVTVLMLAEVMNIFMMPVLIRLSADQQIHNKACRCSYGCFGSQNFQNHRDGHRF